MQMFSFSFSDMSYCSHTVCHLFCLECASLCGLDALFPSKQKRLRFIKYVNKIQLFIIGLVYINVPFQMKYVSSKKL